MAKELKRFAELLSLEKKKFLGGRLGTKVDELFSEKRTVEEDMAGDQQQSMLNPSKHE